MRRRRRNRAGMAAMDEINMTPLLDLTFLLLIVFMITMPLMEYGTAINPPAMDSDKLPTENFRSITLTKNGTVMLDKDVVAREELIGRLRSLREANPKLELLLRADGDQSYRAVIELMAEIRGSGFADVTLVTQAEGK